MVVVVTARPVAFVVVTTPTDDDVETPLNVDAASITIGVSVVASELPVVVSVATTTLVTCDLDIVATVPTPEAVYFVEVVVDTPLNVDAGSITIGVSVVASELPVVVSVATTTLVTCDADIVATVPTPEAVCFVDVVVDNPPE